MYNAEITLLACGQDQQKRLLDWVYHIIYCINIFWKLRLLLCKYYSAFFNFLIAGVLARNYSFLCAFSYYDSVLYAIPYPPLYVLCGNDKAIS